MATGTEQEKHQGFTNYETFAVGVWIDNERELLAEVQEMVRNAAQLEDWSPAAVLKEWVYDRMPEDLGDGPWGSLLRAGFDEIDFTDLAEHYLVDTEDIHEQMKRAGVPLDRHESDLYAKVTPEATEIVNAYRHKANVTTFTSNIDGEAWFDIPFAYSPYWARKAR